MDNKVLVVMGSDSDLPILTKAFSMLNKFGIGYEAHVASAHRTPAYAIELASTARDKGFKVIIAAAGLAAHLGGVLAANTTLPVIGIPCKGGALNGVDALYATVQMPTGIPVATVAIDGGANAAILAIEILSIADDDLAKKLSIYKEELANEVYVKDSNLSKKLEEMN